tara:strand:- start:416 stop:751 length:336 start_codon:yes stop_codon:yes gene_type:complete
VINPKSLLNAYRYGKSPLHAASGQGFSPICTVLLEAGSNGSQQDSTGMTPLHDAAYKAQLLCYDVVAAHPSCDAEIREHLEYIAEQIRDEKTGIKSDAYIAASHASHESKK